MISVIVPIYNVEKYLSKCIESIISQTYKNIEIILVDDGSPDNCGIICDKYAQRDARIVVIHKENGGLSSARNAGLDVAKGDFIGFVDSDDWIEPTMYEEMLELMQSKNLDVVECGINLVSEAGITAYPSKNTIVISGKEALKLHLSPKDLSNQNLPRTAVWSKLFRKSFWLSNRFPVGKIHEDYLLTCQVLYESEKVGLLRKGLLNHLVDNPNSIVNTRFNKNDLYKEKQLNYRIEYLKSHGETELVNLAMISYYCYLVSAIWRCDQNGLSEKNEFINKIKKDYPIILQLNIPLKRRIDLTFIYYCPILYLFLRRLFSHIRSFLS